LLRSGADGTTIPGTIQSVVLARLDGLPPPDKAALQAASVLGQRFELAALRHLLQDADYDCATLVARDLVKREAVDAGHWMFGHALIRDGAYASVLHSGRRALHLRAADWYDERDATLHAEHLDRADDPRAGDAYLTAARAEAVALRIDSALRLLRRGSELDAPVPVRHALAQLEASLPRRGDAPNAVAAFGALPLAGDDARARRYIGIAAASRNEHRGTRIRGLDRARDVAARGPRPRTLAHPFPARNLISRRQRPCLSRGNERRSIRATRGRPECEAQAWTGWATPTTPSERCARPRAFSRCVAICEQQGLARFAIMNDAMLAIIDTWLATAMRAGRLARSRATARDWASLAEAMNEEVTGWMLVAQGRFDQAHGHLTHGLALSREIGARRYELMCLMLLARVDWQRGNRDSARVQLDSAWSLSEQTSHGFIGAAVQGAKALAAANDDERRRALARGEELLREYSIAHCHIWFNRDAIQASLECGEWS
jgi:hypothetical protein